MSSISYGSEIGINFGAVMQPVNINNNFSVITGGKAGVNITKNYFAGLALYGMTLFKKELNGTDINSKLKPTLELNYYGVEFEYYLHPENTMHFSAGFFAGMADIYFDVPVSKDADSNLYVPGYKTGVSNLIIQPSVNFNLNLKSFYRVVLGFSYRFFPNFEYTIQELLHDSNNTPYTLKSENINGFAINFVVRLGSF